MGYVTQKGVMVMSEETVVEETVETPTQETETSIDETTEVEGTILGGGEEGDGEEKSSEEGSKEERTKGDVPEKYEFTLPEGMELDNKLADTITPIFKEIGVSQEQAQKLVDAYAPYVQEQVKAQQEESINYWKEQVEGWKTESLKSLGANPKKEMTYAGKAIEKFGSKELRAAFENTGFGNHPEIVKFCVNVGKRLAEDSLAEPHKQTSVSLDDPTILFDTHRK